MRIWPQQREQRGGTGAKQLATPRHTMSAGPRARNPAEVGGEGQAGPGHRRPPRPANGELLRLGLSHV